MEYWKLKFWICADTGHKTYPIFPYPAKLIPRFNAMSYAWWNVEGSDMQAPGLAHTEISELFYCHPVLYWPEVMAAEVSLSQKQQYLILLDWEGKSQLLDELLLRMQHDGQFYVLISLGYGAYCLVSH